MKKKLTFSLRTVTAVLCTLMLLLQLLSFLNSAPLASIQYSKNAIAQKKESIESYNGLILARQSEVDSKKQEVANLTTELSNAQNSLSGAESALASAENALDRANDALDLVCSRNYYSSYWCDDECRSLHSNVSSKDDAVDAARSAVYSWQDTVGSLGWQIDNLNSEIAHAEGDITYYQDEIEACKAEISALNGQLAKGAFVLILKILSLLLMLAGLGLTGKCLFQEENDKKLLTAAFGAIAASSLLSLFVGSINRLIAASNLLLNPHTYVILIMALFVGVLLEKLEKPVVFRNIAVVLAVIAAPLSILHGQLLISVSFSITLICLAFVVVPLVFTKYIKIAKHIFLSLITLGIWQLVWTYHVTKNLNEVEGVEARKPRNELLLCMFLPFFYPFWLFKTAECVETFAQEQSKVIHLEIVALVFAFINPLFATVLIQNKINVVVGKPEEPSPAPIEEAAPAEETAPSEEAASC